MSVRELVIKGGMGLPYPTGSMFEGALEMCELSDGRSLELPHGFGNDLTVSHWNFFE